MTDQVSLKFVKSALKILKRDVKVLRPIYSIGHKKAQIGSN